MFKNTSGQKLTVFAFDSTTNLPKTGDAANITAYRDLDDGGVTVLSDTTATEKDSTNAKGYYIFDLTQAETNGDKILFSAKSSTANIVVIAVPAVVYTLPATGILAPATAGRTLVVDASGLADANMVKAGPSGSGTAQTARDIGGALPSAAAGASGGLLISGSNSGTTTFGAITCTGQLLISDGMQVDVATTNRDAFKATGNGTGSGVNWIAGATGTGFKVTASGSGKSAIVLTNGSGAYGILAGGGISGNLFGSVNTALDNQKRIFTDTFVSATANTGTINGTVNSDSCLIGAEVIITSGLDYGETRTITAWNNSTAQFTIDRSWSVTPTAGDSLQIFYANNPKLDSSLRVTDNTSYPSNFSSLAIDASGRIQFQYGTSTGQFNLTGGKLTSASLAADTIDSNALAASGVNEIVDAVWDEVAAGHQTTGSFGKTIGDQGSFPDTIWDTVISISALLNSTYDGLLGVLNVNAGYIAGTTAQASIRNSIGLASANLDTQLSGVPAAVWASGTRTLTAGTNIQLPANGLALITQLGAAVTLPGQGAPSATPTLDQAIAYLYKFATNPMDVNKDTGIQQYYNRAGSTVDHKRTVSDDGTTFSMGALATGP